MGDKAIKNYLTGLYNRSFIFESLTKILEMIKRNGKRIYCIVYIDLDNFKWVNDTFGHHEGNRVLKRVAEPIQRNLKGDIVRRIGGDEFMVIIYDCPRNRIIKHLESLTRNIENSLSLYGISLSYGIVEIPKDGVELDTLLKLADERMYEMKRFKQS